MVSTAPVAPAAPEHHAPPANEGLRAALGMKWRPFDRPLGELEQSDLEGLIVPEPIPEGLFVEYKRDWQPQKLARAAASFANSPGGGTVVVGMEADKLYPTRLVGVDMDPGELEEAAVNTIRSSVAPTPAFRPSGILLSDGRSSLVVEVPEGTQPPYIVIRTGQILERTSTSSDPVPIHNRETLDRLYSLGRRGKEWAYVEAERQIQELGDAPDVSGLWTIPAVEDGLGANAIVFRESTLDRLSELPKSSFEGYLSRPQQGGGSDFIQATWTSPSKRTVAARLQTTGVVRVLWWGPEGGSDPLTLVIRAREFLPRHALLLEEVLQHRGDVVVAAFTRWKTPQSGVQRVRVIRQPESLSGISSQVFIEELDREVRRASGDFAFEPGPGPPG